MNCESRANDNECSGFNSQGHDRTGGWCGPNRPSCRFNAEGAATTTRAVAEQATATEQVSKETDRLTVQFAGLAKSMGEQERNCREITVAAKDFQKQTQEAGGAMKEQLKAMKEFRTGSANITKADQINHEDQSGKLALRYYDPRTNQNGS